MMDSGTRLWALMLVAASLVRGATLTGPSQIVNSGESLSISLSLATGGQAISGLQFDLSWNPGLDIQVIPGAEAGISNKVLYTDLLQPGVLRCLLIGVNNSGFADGEALRLLITVRSGASAGLVPLNLLNLSATGPDGTPVPLQGSPIGMQVQTGNTVLPFQASGILNAGSLAAGPVCPGEIVTLFGPISTTSPVVLFNGIPATIVYGGMNQVNAIVPFGLDVSNPAQIEILQSGLSATVPVPAAPASPAIFTLNSAGTGPGAILNQDYSVNTTTKPAAPGTAIMIYGTGFGMLNPTPADGQAQQGAANTVSAVTATIDGIPAEVFYAGAAPGLIAGVEQINVRVPEGAHTNPAAPILLRLGSFATQAGVTVAIQ